MAQTITLPYSTQLSNGLRWARAYIRVIDDAVSIYDNTHLIEYKIQTQSQNEKNLLGNAIAKYAQVKLQNPTNNTYDLVGKRIEIFAGLTLNIGEVSETVEYLSQGIFRIYDAAKDTDNQSITLECYDGMVRFNVEYSDSGLTFPMTLANFISGLCISVGLELGNTVFTNSTFLIERPNVADKEYNIRTLLGWAAQIAASNAVMGIDNKVYIKGLGTSSIFTISPALYYEFKQEPLYGPINFVEMTREALGDTIDYPDITPVNPTTFRIIDNMIGYNQRAALITPIYTAVNGKQYFPFKLKWRGTGHLEFMDRITITDSNSVSFDTYVLNSILTFNGALSEELSALAYTGAGESVKNSGNVRQNIKYTNARVDKVEGTITLVAADLEDLSSDYAKIVLDVSTITSSVQDVADDLSTMSTTVTQTASNLTTTIQSVDGIKQYYQYDANSLTIGREDSPAQIKIGYVSNIPVMTLTDGQNDTAVIQSNQMSIKNIIVGETLNTGRHTVKTMNIGGVEYTVFLPQGV